jgi:hypothetical protein
MPTEFWLAYGGYLIWLAAGLGDFICHRRTDLPHTSGIAESATHLIQLALLGSGVVVLLAFEVGQVSALLLLALVLAHAVVGYVDTRIAFGRHRVLLPIEQHLHSVLDMAPIIAFAWVLISTWPAPASAGAALQPRSPALPMTIWAAVLLPPLALCIAPALIEFRAAWTAAHRARA